MLRRAHVQGRKITLDLGLVENVVQLLYIVLMSYTYKKGI